MSGFPCWKPQHLGCFEMGSFKIAAMTEQEVVDRYLTGEARGMIALRAKKTDAWVVTVLTRWGVPIRNQQQSLAFSIKSRVEQQAMREGRIREYARGTTGRRRA